jgi:septum formation protein
MLILASKSETRKALLAGAGIAFEARSAGVNERAIEAAAVGDGAGAAEVAQRLAEAKALAVSGEIVVGADQVLALDGALLHKVETMDAARLRLDQLRGRTHQLHAGVTLARDGQVIWSAFETAHLTMRDFSDAERDVVLALEGEAVLATVGAYRYEGPSIRLFEKIEGDYFAILGLPLLPLLAALRQFAPSAF